ncbi:5-hydroxytryptamine receptor 1A-like [Lytechinus variegatus]|uniref:5-hydroxytryptamine receptor 1A-like n=1 Tax=Lytechinus variegatus TaxID=7654 RepID=UPI001BB1381E|nr:5-hydroxytryptamine receptor 1A-like [Lytechinus variegatus]
MNSVPVYSIGNSQEFANMSNISDSTLTPTMPTMGNSSNIYLYKDLDLPQRVVLSIILLITSITGIVGNSVVILAIVLSRKLRSTLNWFVLNLACADLVTSLCIPLHVVDLLGRMGWVKLNWFQLSWQYSSWFYINTTCVGVSLTTHALIGFTSWYRITKSQDKFKKLYKARNVGLMITFGWIFNLASLCLIVKLDDKAVVYPIAFWVFGHFAIVVAVYIRLWRFVARHAEKQKSRNDVNTNRQNMTTTCPDGNTSHEGLSVSNSSEHLGSHVNDVTNGSGMAVASDQLEIHDQGGKTMQLSQSLSEKGITAESTEGRRKVLLRGSEIKEINSHVKKQAEPKIDKKLIAVTKNLMVILVAFTICFIPYAVSLCSSSFHSALPWLLALLLFNSCMNPIIYARRIQTFREVMVCIIRCRLGSIPLPIELVRKLRTSR